MGGSSKGKKKITVAYKYFVGQHLGLCHGEIDSVLKVRVKEKLAWEGNSSTSFTVNSPKLFGGDPPEGQGGWSGTIDILTGNKDQERNPYLQSKLGNDCPAFRGIASVVLRQCYIGNSPNLDAISFLVKRILKRSAKGEAQWYQSKAAIKTYDMNPVHIIREALTNKEWGVGGDSSVIDDANFMSVADTLYREGLGLSFIWAKEDKISDFIQNILDHIQGSLFIDRHSGKYKLKLVRGDYNNDDLIVLDGKDIISMNDYSKPTYTDLVSQITVKYWDREKLCDDSVTVHNPAVARLQNQIIDKTVTYGGVCSKDLAIELATRDLLSAGSPLVSCSIECTPKKASQLELSDPFIVNYPDLGINNIVMRVADIKIGTESNPTVTIKATQDTFSKSASIFTAPESEWESPISDPQPPQHQMSMTMPYIVKAALYGDLLNSSDDLTEHAIFAASKPTSDTLNSSLYIKESGGDYELINIFQFMPVLTLSNDINQMATEIAIGAKFGADYLSIGSLAAIGNELVKVESYNYATNVLTVSRGVGDTIPSNHQAGDLVYQFQTNQSDYLTPLVEGEVINYKITTTTMSGELSLSDASPHQLIIEERNPCPYPPANVKINEEYFPLQTTGDLNITWSARNREIQADNAVGWFDIDVTADNSVSYKLTIVNQDTGIIIVNEEIAETSYTLTLDAETTITGTQASNIKVSIETHQTISGDEYISYQKFEHTFNRIVNVDPII